MQMSKLPRPIKKAFRFIVATAQEAEVRRALESVRRDFGEWKAGKIDSSELADRIHTFDNGPNRDIDVRYMSQLDPHVLVQCALGLIKKESIPKELWPYLEGLSALRRRCRES